MKRTFAHVAAEPALIPVAVPPLLFPQGYLWQWQHGVFHYATIDVALVPFAALAVVALVDWLRGCSARRRSVARSVNTR